MSASYIACMKPLHSHLRRTRTTQADFARLMGVSQPTVSDWLSGKKNPRVAHLLRIANLTGASVDALLDRAARAHPSRRHASRRGLAP